MSKQYVCDSFTLDELGEWQGVHIPSERWNGWACPWFTLETCREIAEVINALPDNEEKIVVTESQVFSVYIGNGEEEVTEVEPSIIAGAEFFPLGSWGWVWEVAQECYGCIRAPRAISVDEAQGHHFCFGCETKVLGGK